MNRRLLAAALAVLPFTTAAQAPPPVPTALPQTLTLRTSVDQVVVDVVVTDADGAPVSGLTAADFEILERSQPQSVATFSEVSLPLVRRDTGAPEASGDVRSNRRADEARVYILLLDDANVRIEYSPVVQRAAREFVRRYVQTGDLVAVLTTTGLGVTRQEPTQDLRLVDAAITRFFGYGTDAIASASESRAASARANRNADPMKTQRRSTTLIDDGSVDPQDDASDSGRDRARLMFRTLENVAESVATIPGRRKSLLFFSEGPPIAARDAELQADQARVIGAAARANVSIYAIDPKGLDHPTAFDARGIEAAPGSLDPQAVQRSRDMNMAVTGILVQRRLMAAATLKALADGTGGLATIDRTNVESALERVASDSSHYYLLGYAPVDRKREGRYRSIEVRLKKPGLHVSARQGYLEPDDKALRKAQEKAQKAGGIKAGPLVDLIRRPVPTAGLTMRAQAIVLPLGRNNVRVVVEIAPQALLLDGTPPRDAMLDLVIVPVGPGGQVGSTVEGHATLAGSPEDAAAIREHGMRLLEQLTLPPGRHQLRIAARESVRGTAGSVLCEVDIPDPKGGLTLSSIVLSSRQAGRTPSASRDEALETALGGRPPTTDRSFAGDDVMSAYAEVIDAGAASVRPIEVATVIRTAAGKELVRSPQPNANQNVAAGRSFAYVVDLPLKTLVPGRYTLRVEARAAGADGVVARDVPFEVRSPTP